MKKDTQQQFIEEIMGDDFTRQIIAELEIQNLPPEIQAEIISMLGQNVMSRVVLEIVKVLPKSQYDTFESFMDSGDLDGLRAFLMPHIPDLSDFVRREASKEYEGTKMRLHRARQGVSDS